MKHRISGTKRAPKKIGRGMKESKKRRQHEDDFEMSGDDPFSDIDFSALEQGMSEEEFWARKLGISGDSAEHNKARLAEEYAKDGLGDDFLELFDFMDEVRAKELPNSASSSEPADLTPSKYVPPHLRKGATTSEGAMSVTKKRETSLLGLLNRVSEGNIDSISREIVSVIVNQKLSASSVAQSLVNIACDNPHITVTLQGTFAGITCAIAAETAPSNQYSGSMLAELTKRILHSITDDSKQRTVTNLVRFTSCLFSLGLFGVDVMDSLLTYLVDTPQLPTEKRLEWVLACLRFSGRVLRDHHKQRFISILDRLSSKLSALTDGGKQAAFALKELMSMKDGKSNFRAVDHLQTVCEWLIIRNSQSSKFKASEGSTLTGWKVPKEIESVQLVVPSVCFLFSGAYSFPSGWTDSIPSEPSQETAAPNNSVSLEELASMHRMTTEVKKNAFVAIMGSVDANHALIRLDQFGLLDKPKYFASIVSVIVHCAMQESSLNPFYVELMRSLCASQRDIKRDRKFSISFKIEFSKLITEGKLNPTEIGLVSALIAHYIQLSNGAVTMQDILSRNSD